MNDEADLSMPVVIDTNVALDLLVFDDPACASLRAALDARELRWVVSAPMRDELARVLAYPAIASHLERAGRDVPGVLAAFDARATRVQDAIPRASCICSDADDQMFIDLAVACHAGLISKDRAVLALRKRLLAQGVVVMEGGAFTSGFSRAVGMWRTDPRPGAKGR